MKIHLDYNKLQLVMARKCIDVNTLVSDTGLCPGLFARMRSQKNDTKLENIGLIAKSLKVDVSEITSAEREESKTMKINHIKLQICVARSCKTRKQISSETGLNPATIDNLLNGKTASQLSSIGLLARCLNVDVLDIADAE